VFEAEPAGSIAPPLDTRDVVEPTRAMSHGNNRGPVWIEAIDDPVFVNDHFTEIVAAILRNSS